VLKILVVGAGSIGTFLGTQLYAAGHQVVLYGRRKLESLVDPIFINGQTYRLPPRCYQVQVDDYNAIFVTTKLYDIKNALAQLRKFHLNPQIIAFIQNGIVEPEFYEGWQNHPGFTTLSIFNGYHLAGNQILVRESHLGWQIENSPVGQKIAELLKEAGIQCTVSSNIVQMRAQKLIANAALNALSALEKKTIGELIADQNLKAIVDGIIQESWAVLQEDYSLPSLGEVQATIYGFIPQVWEHYSSMYQDLISGRKTEVDFLNGFIIKLGQEKGIPTPCNQQVYSKLLEKADSRKFCQKDLSESSP
jgi:2-dehydropantoate 2-reductase